MNYIITDDYQISLHSNGQGVFVLFFFTTGVPNQGAPPSVDQGSQWKGSAQGQGPFVPSQPNTDRNKFGVNGFSATQNPMPSSVNSQSFGGPSSQGQSFMNGPSGLPPANQLNQPYQPNMISNQGQFQPTQPPTSVGINRPPGVPAFGPHGPGGHVGPRPSQVGPTGSPGQVGPPLSHTGQSTSGTTSEGN